jgi:hypothetical protein
MQLHREIIKPSTGYHSIKVPEWAIGHDIEVTLSPVLVSEKHDNESKGIAEDPIQFLGHGKKFGMQGTTKEWMREIREGEEG